MREQYALFWSKKANAFHMGPLAHAIESGLRFFAANQTNDYLLIAIGTYEEVGDKADAMRPVLQERDDVRRLYDDGAFE